VRFARREREPNRQAAAIDYRMYLAGQTASRTAHGLSLVASDTSGVLMNAHNRRVDHLDGGVMSSSQCVHDPAPDARPTPANEAIVTSRLGAKLLRQVAPRCARSQDPKDAVQDTAVVYTRDTPWRIRQHRLDGSPLTVGEFIAHGVFRSFLAGVHDVHVFTEYEDEQVGFQVNFTLLGAYRFLNITMSDIANRCLDLGDLLGDAEAKRLADSLHDAADWPARFDLMDGFLLERLRRGRPMSPDVAWALKSLQASHGARSIGALSRDLACSRRP
jgi:hypothetical protein